MEKTVKMRKNGLVTLSRNYITDYCNAYLKNSPVKMTADAYLNGVEQTDVICKEFVKC